MPFSLLLLFQHARAKTTAWGGQGKSPHHPALRRRTGSGQTPQALRRPAEALSHLSVCNLTWTQCREVNGREPWPLRGAIEGSFLQFFPFLKSTVHEFFKSKMDLYGVYLNFLLSFAMPLKITTVSAYVHNGLGMWAGTHIPLVVGHHEDGSFQLYNSMSCQFPTLLL